MMPPFFCDFASLLISTVEHIVLLLCYIFVRIIIYVLIYAYVFVSILVHLYIFASRQSIIELLADQRASPV